MYQELSDRHELANTYWTSIKYNDLVKVLLVNLKDGEVLGVHYKNFRRRGFSYFLLP